MESKLEWNRGIFPITQEESLIVMNRIEDNISNVLVWRSGHDDKYDLLKIKSYSVKTFDRATCNIIFSEDDDETIQIIEIWAKHKELIGAIDEVSRVLKIELS